MKKIKFLSTEVDLDILKPLPASLFMPKWYNNIPEVNAGKQTLKACTPFFDVLSAGYMIVLASDVFYDGANFQQVSKKEVISLLPAEQFEGVELSNNYSTQPYRWNNFFISKTPKGYSSLFIHPMNRLDLPFYTLSGIVDTDNYPAQVDLPFFIRNNFIGTIPAGTPIAQVIPFKRTEWKSSVEDKKKAKIPAEWFNNSKNPPFSFYKNKYWKNKRYQ